jgi:ligand-binding sensor domain-containing protein/serine phosphatase RsbU (regulator of sigma subunit)
MNRIPGLLPLLIVFSLGNNIAVKGQKYEFRQYGIDEGICYPFVYTVNQDKNGYIWAATGEGLCKFNGFSFTGDITKDSLPPAFVKKAYRDEEGNLWFGHNDGSITRYDGTSFIIINTQGIITSTINDIIQDENGNLLFATQNQGIIVVSKDLQSKRIVDPFRRKLLTSMCFTAGNKFFAGTYDGLYLYEYDAVNDTAWQISKINGIPSTAINSIKRLKDKDIWLVGTQDEGLYCLKVGVNGDPEDIFMPDGPSSIQNSSIIALTEDSRGHIWLSTRGGGVYKIDLSDDSRSVTRFTNFNESNGLGSMNTRDVFEDKEGNIWVSTYGNGLAALFDEAFIFYKYENVLGSDIYAVLPEGESYWIGGKGKIMKIFPGTEKDPEIYGASNGLPNDGIASLYIDAKNNLWIGTANVGLYKMNLKTRSAAKYYSAGNSLENMVNSIAGYENMVWVGTNNGVIEIDLDSGSQRHLGTTEGLPHNKINDIFVDSEGVAWIATRTNGLFSINSTAEHKILGSFVLEFVSITQDQNGYLWAATDNDGVFKFIPENDSLNHFATYNSNLKSNSCYSITSDGNGNIWVGHRLGMSKIDIETGRILTYGTADGITGDCIQNAAAVTDEGVVLLGSSDGLITFNTKEERKNLTPPFLNISSVIINDRAYDISKPVILPYGIYKMRVDFIGLNYRSPDLVTYQYKLDGYDDWSEPARFAYVKSVGIPNVQYSRVEDGNYTFMLKACNSEGICNEAPLQFILKIKLPIWKTWWFITLSVLILIFSVYVIIKFRERKQKQFQEMLQRKLDERTREVVMQKEEIEIKNKDITDSINYAQRIQASILPPISKLQENFSGSFVFYQPRDIVSGDFYWYEKFDLTRFLIVCADSTGHGVPGAFMSMIGTTLIKDICGRTDFDSPANLLKTLDREIMSALNQNIEAEKSNDGMDIIVAEINLKDFTLKVASAMRPMIIYKDGEQIYVRGSRSSVGGQYEMEEKEFDSQDFRLSKGDKIYMFSDGYPDQFGGPLGRKFKMVRLKNMLRDIHDKPMDEQYNYIKNNFELWKEDIEQVDDVLFMGIEL